MAKRATGWSEEKFKRYINEGRGRGEGFEYKPWKLIHDFPSRGRCSRILGGKTGRVHHLFSDIESRFFYLMEWENVVVDIRESFPLLDLEEVIGEKDDLRLDLFKDKESGIPYVLTTSFLITLKENGKYRYVARSVKASSELDKKATIEKFEIEKRYWNKKGVDWSVITQNEIPLIKAKNVEWIHSALYTTNDRGFSDKEIIEMEDILVDGLYTEQKPLRTVLSNFDLNYNLSYGSALFFFKHMIASKKIMVDMNKEINTNVPGREIILEINSGMESCRSVSS